MRFVVCGEALIDLIPVDEGRANPSGWQAYCGGGPFNTAVALARLGAPVQFLGRMGADAYGQQLITHLENNEVGLDLLVQTDQSTSLAVVSLDDAGKAHYTFHFHDTSNFGWRTHEFPTLSADDWLHFGSISAVGEPGATALREFLSRVPGPISYDINVRPGVQPDMERYLADVSELMALVGRNRGIVKGSDEDISHLVGAVTDPLDVAAGWVEQHGLSMFLVTLGADGVVALLPDGGRITVPGHPVELVDTVGAGDTFMAAFLAQYVNEAGDVEAALRSGVAAAALVCERAGAHPPTVGELNRFLGSPA